MSKLIQQLLTLGRKRPVRVAGWGQIAMHVPRGLVTSYKLDILQQAEWKVGLKGGGARQSLPGPEKNNQTNDSHLA